MTPVEEFMTIVESSWLTRQQIRLLCILMRTSPMVVTPHELVSASGGDSECDGTGNLVRVAICKLRDALDCYGYRQCVVTVKSAGYRWDPLLKELPWDSS